MKKYGLKIIFVITTIYFIMSFYEIALKQVLLNEVKAYTSQISNAVNSFIAEEFSSAERITKSFYDPYFHESSDVSKELIASSVQNDERRLVVNRKDVVLNLKKYMNLNDFFVDAYILTESGETYIYTSENSFNNRFLERNIKYSAADVVTKTLINEGMCNEKAIVFSYPIYNRDDIHLGTINFEVSYSRLKEGFAELAMNLGNCYLTITDYNHEEIFSNKNVMDVSSGRLNKIFATGERIDKNYNLIASTSEYEDFLTIEIAINEKDILKSLYIWDAILLNIGMLGIIFITLHISVIKSDKVHRFILILGIVAGLILYLFTMWITKTEIVNTRKQNTQNLIDLYQFAINLNMFNSEKAIIKLAENLNENVKINQELQQIRDVLNAKSCHIIDEKVTYSFPNAIVAVEEQIPGINIEHLYNQYKDTHKTNVEIHDDSIIMIKRLEDANRVLIVELQNVSIFEYFAVIGPSLIEENSKAQIYENGKHIKMIEERKYALDDMEERSITSYYVEVKDKCYISISFIEPIFKKLETVVLTYNSRAFNYTNRLFNTVVVIAISIAIFVVIMTKVQENKEIVKKKIEDTELEKLEQIEELLVDRNNLY